MAEAPGGWRWSVALVLAVASVTSIFALWRAPDRRAAALWLTLGVMALVLAGDEVLNLHRALRLLPRPIALAGPPDRRWLIAALAGAAVAGAILVPLAWAAMRACPAPARLLLAAAGLLYLVGLTAGKLAGGAPGVVSALPGLGGLGGPRRSAALRLLGGASLAASGLLAARRRRGEG